MKLFFILLFANFSLQILAQQYQPNKINTKAIKTYQQAIEYLKDDALPEAIPLLLKSSLMPAPLRVNTSKLSSILMFG